MRCRHGGRSAAGPYSVSLDREPPHTFNLGLLVDLHQQSGSCVIIPSGFGAASGSAMQIGIPHDEPPV